MIPAELYNYYYNNAMLLILCMTLFVYVQGIDRISVIDGYNRFNFWLIALTMMLYLGTRPISGLFVDMPAYEWGFNSAAATGVSGYPDWLFNIFTEFFAEYFSINIYFLAISALYVLPMAWAAQRIHLGWGLALLLAFLGAFSFFTYGVNGIRNGVAMSLVILAFSFSDRKLVTIAILVAAIGFHKSAAIPAVCFLMSMFWSRIGFSAAVWLGCLFANLAFGERLAPFISSLIDFGDDSRLAGYTSGMGSDVGGFRLDFILYSIVPAATSYMLANNSVRAEIFYRRLMCTYLLSNATWLLLMHASQSNRFAYLSWFMLPWVTVYPLIPVSRFSNENIGGLRKVPRITLLGLALVAHHSFTYVMAIFIYPATRG